MIENGESGSIITLMCDSGERYSNTYYNAEWVESEIGSTDEYDEHLQKIKVA